MSDHGRNVTLRRIVSLLPMQITPQLHFRLSVVVCGFLRCFAAVDAGELKVDINRDTKNLDSVTEVGYTKWSQDTTGGATSGTAAATKTFTTATGETVTISFSQTVISQSRGGTGLLT